MPRSKLQKSQLQEQALARLFGGRVQSGSGNHAENPNDVYGKNILLEAKYTDDKSFTVHKSVLDDLEENALNRGKTPVFVFGFADGDRVHTNWIAIPMEYSDTMKGLLYGEFEDS